MELIVGGGGMTLLNTGTGEGRFEVEHYYMVIALGSKKKSVEAVWKRRDRMPVDKNMEEVLVRSWCSSLATWLTWPWPCTSTTPWGCSKPMSLTGWPLLTLE
jgi:hypothetical protein